MATVDLADMHIHSTASDGYYDPKKLTEMVARSGLKAFALTDHDTLDGLAEAGHAADKLEIELVPGVEISAVHKEKEIHILGYYPRNTGDLSTVLADLRKGRRFRMEMMVGKLQDRGFRITSEEVVKLAGNAAPGRLHLARLLHQKKYVSTINEAFQLYLGREGPAYVGRKLPEAGDAIELLIQSGAVPVYAHPGEKGKEDLSKLVSLGLQGIEVYHPDHNRNLTALYRDFAENNGLLITGGSDFHGPKTSEINHLREYAVNMELLIKLKRYAGII